MSRLAPFARHDLTYHTINGVPLEATVLVPRRLLINSQITAVGANGTKQRKLPVMVLWHGGGFLMGHRVYEPWLAHWLLDLAVDTGALIVSPDYRLLPESTAAEMLDDIAHFWRWLRRGRLAALLPPEWPRPDLGRVLCCGGSAGGFLAAYCPLYLDEMLSEGENRFGEEEDGGVEEKPQELCIRAVISISSPLDTSAPEHTVPRPRIIMGQRPPPPHLALERIRSYIRSIPPGAVRTGSEPSTEMWGLLLCVTQQAYLPRLFERGWPAGKKERPTGSDGLQEAMKRKGMVPLWVVHGKEDSICPANCSVGFVDKLRSAQPKSPVRFDLREGEHLFDVDLRMGVGWIREGVDFIRAYWLG